MNFNHQQMGQTSALKHLDRGQEQRAHLMSASTECRAHSLPVEPSIESQ